MTSYLLEKISRGIRSFRIPILIALVVIVGILIANSNTSSITGKVTAITSEIHIQELNLALDKSQNYILNLETNPDSPFQLKYIKLSGYLSGDKNVKIYIENKQGEKFLIFDGSTLQVDKFGEISVSSGISGDFEGKEVEFPKELEIRKEVVLSFRSVCIDTCDTMDKGFDKKTYILSFEIPEDSVVNIENIEYSLEKEEEVSKSTVNLGG